MRSVLAVLAVLALAGCGKKEDAPDEGGKGGPTPTEGSAANPSANRAAFEARRTFQTICQTCHGATGKGDGMAAAALNPKPRNYTDKVWQASVTDDDIKNIILHGGQAVGKSAQMPAQPQLANQPEVVAELVKIIRAFGK